MLHPTMLQQRPLPTFYPAIARSAKNDSISERSASNRSNIAHSVTEQVTIRQLLQPTVTVFFTLF